jgi:hypothetical protein
MKIEHRPLLSRLLTVGLSQKAAVLWKARDILLPSRIGGPERGQATLALLASEYLADDRPNRPDLLRRARLRANGRACTNDLRYQNCYPGKSPRHSGWLRR